MKFNRQPSGGQLYAQELNALRSDAAPAAFLHAHQQSGTFAMPTNPTNGQTISLIYNSTAVVLTGKTGTLVNPGDFKIQASAALTAAVVQAGLINPTVTTATWMGLNTTPSAPNAVLIQYAGYGYPTGGTNIIVYSLNTSTASPLSTFSATTTVTGASWTAQTLRLYVEPGAYFIGGTRYLFLGGSTTAVTAPVSNPRIDVLSIDNTGTLNWTTGTENASPVAPAYPANQIPLCEVWNVVGETGLFAGDNQQAGQGFIYNDVRPTMSYGIPFGAVPDDIIPDVTNTRSLGTGADQWLNIYGENVFINGALVAATKFGGTGADGALTLTSGTTTLSFASANYLVKNYTSVSITSTAVLAFSTPATNGSIFVMKSQGAVTLTSSSTPCIDLRGIGSASNNDGIGLTKGPTAAQNILAGVEQSGPSFTAWVSILPSLGVHANSGPHAKMAVYAGVGGCGPWGAATNAGANGRGGGGLLIECAGAMNFTGTIDCSGQNGSNGSGSTSWDGNYGPSVGGASNGNGPGASGGWQQTLISLTFGGSGGGAGSIVILAFSFTANSGTMTANGGTHGTGTFQNGSDGAAGLTYSGLNTEFS